MDARLLKRLNKTATVQDIIEIMGGRVYWNPVSGTQVCLPEGRSIPERDIRDCGRVQVAYEMHAETQEVTRIYIGHEYAGPMLSCAQRDGDGKGWTWANLYSNHNYGKNAACGGTWGSNSKDRFKTATEAMEHRTYEVGGITYTRSKLTESALLLGEVMEVIEQFEG